MYKIILFLVPRKHTNMYPCQLPTSLNFNDYISPIIHKYVFLFLPINHANRSPFLIDPFHRAANVMHLGVVRRGFRCLGGFSLMVDGDGLSCSAALACWCHAFGFVIGPPSDVCS